MWNEHSNHKKFTFASFIILVIICLTFNLFSFKNVNCKIAYAESSEEEVQEELEENISDILDDIDSSSLDSFINNDFNLDYFSSFSFKTLVINILSGVYFDEYDSFLDAIFSFIKSNFKSIFSVFLSLFVLIVLHQLFISFCSDKFKEIKNVVKLIFSLVFTLVLAATLTSFITQIKDTITTLFNFISTLFPILLSLILTSGATSSYGIFNSLSLFLINTGSYIFSYFLFSLAVSIFLVSLFGSITSNKSLAKANDILKSIFKYTIIIFISIFGLLSTINMISSGARDGVTYKLTKFAIKNYIPVLGGYISDGFDFVHTCSVLVKNAFGFCGIIILIFTIIKPVLVYITFQLMLKLMSFTCSLLGEESFSGTIQNVSKSLSYFITILIGIFLIFFVFIYMLICSVSVV